MHHRRNCFLSAPHRLYTHPAFPFPSDFSSRAPRPFHPKAICTAFNRSAPVCLSWIGAQKCDRKHELEQRKTVGIHSTLSVWQIWISVFSWIWTFKLEKLIFFRVFCPPETHLRRYHILYLHCWVDFTTVVMLFLHSFLNIYIYIKEKNVSVSAGLLPERGTLCFSTTADSMKNTTSSLWRSLTSRFSSPSLEVRPHNVCVCVCVCQCMCGDHLKWLLLISAPL